MTIHHAVKQLEGTVLGDAGWQTTSQRETASESIDHLRRVHIIRRHMIDQSGTMERSALVDLTGHKGIADITSDASPQGLETGRRG